MSVALTLIMLVIEVAMRLWGAASSSGGDLLYRMARALPPDESLSMMVFAAWPLIGAIGGFIVFWFTRPSQAA